MEKITFCTACMGRKADLIATLTHNLSVNKYPNAEFLVLDYNSPDGLAEWVSKELRNRLGCDVNFYAERTRKYFFMAHAKNVAALLGTGDIIVNIDADQFMGPDFGFQVADAMKTARCFASPLVGPWLHKNPSDAGGILAMRAADFRFVGGYDEDMCHGWGTEDHDIRRRAVALGFRAVRFPTPWRFIRQPDQLRNANTEEKLSKQESAALHRRIHRLAMREKRYVANRNRIAGKAIVVKNFDQVLDIGMAVLPAVPHDEKAG